MRLLAFLARGEMGRVVVRDAADRQDGRLEDGSNRGVVARFGRDAEQEASGALLRMDGDARVLFQTETAAQTISSP
jgi:hypothetical protein